MYKGKNILVYISKFNLLVGNILIFISIKVEFNGK